MTSSLHGPRAALKRYARQLVLRRIFYCMTAAGIFLLFQMASVYFRFNAGGVLSYYQLDAAQYSSETGIRLLPGGLTAFARLDKLGILLALPLAYRQLLFFAASTLLALAAAAPLFMGVLEHYAALLQKRDPPWTDIFRWYLDAKLSLKAVALQLLLAAVKWTAMSVGALPGLLLMLHGMGEIEGLQLVALLGLLLMLAGLLAGYVVYCRVLPAQYALARNPQAPLRSLLTAGGTPSRERRRGYALLRLSFLPWQFLSSITYGATGILIQPYFELSNLLYLYAPEAAASPAGPARPE